MISISNDIMCLSGHKNGDRTSVAVKTCKDCSPDVMEKFMSEAGIGRNVTSHAESHSSFKLNSLNNKSLGPIPLLPIILK